MPKYDVHVYAVFRVLVRNVEADSQEGACERTDVAANFIGFEQPGLEYANDISGFLVDEVGDESLANSHFYNSDYRREG